VIDAESNYPRANPAAFGPAQTPSRVRIVLTWALLGVLLLLLAAIFVPIESYGPVQAKKAASMSNAKQLDLALLMYQDDNDGVLPKAAAWMNRVKPYTKQPENYRSLGVTGAGVFGFAFRRHLGDQDYDAIVEPKQVAMVFDSVDTRWNANGELELLPKPGRYEGSAGRRNIVAFVDGHVRLAPGPDVVVK